MKTLRDLASLATRVAEMIENIENTITTHKEFSNLQNELNELQVAAPNHEAVVAARIRWFNHGLISFEHNFVCPTVERSEGWDEWHQNYCGYPTSPEGLIMHWETLSHFLTRNYLGTTAFAEIYPRVEDMLNRLVQATEGSDLKKLWSERLQQLRQSMLENKI